MENTGYSAHVKPEKLLCQGTAREAWNPTSPRGARSDPGIRSEPTRQPTSLPEAFDPQKGPLKQRIPVISIGKRAKSSLPQQV